MQWSNLCVVLLLCASKFGVFEVSGQVLRVSLHVSSYALCTSYESLESFELWYEGTFSFDLYSWSWQPYGWSWCGHGKYGSTVLLHHLSIIISCYLQKEGLCIHTIHRCIQNVQCACVKQYIYSFHRHTHVCLVWKWESCWAVKLFIFMGTRHQTSSESVKCKVSPTRMKM